MKMTKKAEVKDQVEEVQAVVSEQAAAKPEFTQEELLEVFDTIMFEGFYEEEFDIRGKLKIKFRSKTAKDITSISQELDSKTYNLISTLTEQRAFLSIVYGLVQYGSTELASMKLEDRRSFIEKLPSAIVAMLSDSVNKFDRKVDKACEEGEANF